MQSLSKGSSKGCTRPATRLPSFHPFVPSRLRVPSCFRGPNPSSLVVSGVAFGAMLLWTEETLGRQALALAAACLFPAYAVSFLLGPNLREGEGGGNPETRGHGDTETQESGTLGTSEGEKAAAQARPGLGQALAVLVKVSLVSLSGGLIIAALLADRCFMLQVEQFQK